MLSPCHLSALNGRVEGAGVDRLLRRGALGDGPEPDEFADFGSAVIPGRRAFRPSGLFVVDGGSQCPEGPCSAVGSARSCSKAGCSSSRQTRPRLSFLFPHVPFCSLEASVAIVGEWDTARRKRHSRRSATCLLSTRSGVPSAFLLGTPRSKRGPHHFWCGPLACGNTGRGDRI